MDYCDVPQTRYVKLGALCDKRRGAAPVPLNLRQYLTRHQIRSFHQMENFGWQLAFVRRKEGQFSSAVVVNEGLNLIGLLENDGSINTSASVDVRGSASEPVSRGKPFTYQ